MKGKIKSITVNNDWASIVLEDTEYAGKQLSGNLKFDEKFKELKAGEEIDFSVKEKGGKYYINLTKEKKPFGTPKDWTFEKKRAALEQAVIFGNVHQLKSTEVLQLANKFFDWLK